MVRAPGRKREASWGVPPKLIIHRPPRRQPPTALRMITRAEWNAKPPPRDNLGTRLVLPIRHVRYTFTRTPHCKDTLECIPMIQEMQRDAQSQGLPDVMFNFLVGGDGIIYEGRGWDYKCVQDDDPFVDSPGPSMNIAYIGTYEDSLVPWTMSHAGKHICEWAVHHKLLTKDHEITPSLACFKEGEENRNYFAEAVARLGLDQPQGPSSREGFPVRARQSEKSEDEEESEEEASEVEEGSEDGDSDDDSDKSDGDDSDAQFEDDEDSEESSDDGDVATGEDTSVETDEDDSYEDTEEDSDDDSDEGSDEGSDDDSDEGSDEGSDDDSDEGSDDDSDEGSDEGSDDDSDEGSDESSDDDSDEGSDDNSDEGSDENSDDDSGSGSDVSMDNSDDDGSD